MNIIKTRKTSKEGYTVVDPNIIQNRLKTLESIGLYTHICYLVQDNKKVDLLAIINNANDEKHLLISGIHELIDIDFLDPKLMTVEERLMLK